MQTRQEVALERPRCGGEETAGRPPGAASPATAPALRRQGRLSLPQVCWAGGGIPEPGPPPAGHAELHGGARGGGRALASPPARQQQEEEGGRSAAAAFGQPVSARSRGWPPGGGMLAFRDNSWYQSGNKRRHQRQAETMTARERKESERRPARTPRPRALLCSQAWRQRLGGRLARVHTRRWRWAPRSALCWGGTSV